MYLYLFNCAVGYIKIFPCTTIMSFADDTRLKRAITKALDLEAVYSWADRVNMHFNKSKFEVLQFWADGSAAPDILYMAQDGGPIEKDCTRDLRVQVGTNLMFSGQVDRAVTITKPLINSTFNHGLHEGPCYTVLTIIKELLRQFES